MGNSKVKHSRYSTRYIIYRLFSNLCFVIIINLLVETSVCLASNSLIVFLKISICINICTLITPKFIPIFTVCNKQFFFRLSNLTFWEVKSNELNNRQSLNYARHLSLQL